MHWTNTKKLLAGLAIVAMSTAAFALPVAAASLRMAWAQDATGLDPHKADGVLVAAPAGADL